MRSFVLVLSFLLFSQLMAQSEAFVPCVDDGDILLCGMETHIILDYGSSKPGAINQVVIYAANRTAETRSLEITEFAWTNGVRKELSPPFNIQAMGIAGNLPGKKIELAPDHSGQYVLQIPDGFLVYPNHTDPQAFRIEAKIGDKVIVAYAVLHMELEFPADEDITIDADE